MHKSLWLTLLITIITVLRMPVSAIAGPLPDTGMTKCYNGDGNEITCPVPGQWFYGQDANYIINPPSYTKLDSSGNYLSDSATSWAMVRDNVTGLIWEVKTDDGSIHDKYNTYTWYDPSDPDDPGTPGDGTDTDDFLGALNDAEFGGYSDWRLPSIKELISVVDYSIFDGRTINTTYFPNTVGGYTYYWTSTTDASNTSRAFEVRFINGSAPSAAKSTAHYVRAVRGEKSSNTFVDNGNGTITDTSTGLMWQQDTARDGLGNYDAMTWAEALAYCDNLQLPEDGYTDWRLPNIKEIRSLTDYSQYDPAINETLFPNTVLSHYWSSTSYAYSIYKAYGWLFHFYSGTDFRNNKSSTNYVRAVREGQQQPTVTTAAVSDIAETTATSGGNVTSDGGATVTARGVCWSTTTNPTTANDKTTDGTGTGSFTSSITGLSPGTTYHVRAYATNSVGTSYGSDIPFTTDAETPIAVTGSATSVTPTSATLNGAVNPNGAETAVVFEWGTDTSYGKIATADQSPVSDPGNQPVSVRITGLILGMHYHFRVKATNSEGTGYGEDSTFDAGEVQSMPWLLLLLGD